MDYVILSIVIKLRLVNKLYVEYGKIPLHHKYVVCVVLKLQSTLFVQ